MQWGIIQLHTDIAVCQWLDILLYVFAVIQCFPLTSHMYDSLLKFREMMTRTAYKVLKYLQQHARFVNRSWLSW